VGAEYLALPKVWQIAQVFYEQLLLFGTPLDAVRDTVHRSDYQAIGEGTIDLVRWRAPVQLLKYATRIVWFKNVKIRVTPLNLGVKCKTYFTHEPWVQHDFEGVPRPHQSPQSSP
jgi:hypothetical protein